MLGIPPQTWEEVWALEPGVYSWVQREPITGWQPTDTPTGALRVELTIHGTELHYGSRSLVLAYIDGATYLKRYVGEHGDLSDRLVLIATATSPQEYGLPLAAGMSVQGSLAARYSKNQFNEVIVRGCLTGQKSTGDVVATLPAGFHPKSTFEVPAMFGFVAGRIQIDTEASIRVVTVQSSVSSVQFSAVFIAADV